MPTKKRGRPVEENPKNIRLDIRVTKEKLQILDDNVRNLLRTGHISLSGPLEKASAMTQIIIPC